MEELARITPVRPPKVNKKIKPKDHRSGGVMTKGAPWRVAIQLNTFTPVGTAIIIVAAVK